MLYTSNMLVDGTDDILRWPGLLASNLEQVANLLRSQVNSLSYPQRDC